MKYALIDMGSNTIRMVIYVTEGTTFETLFSKKYMAGLAGYVQEGRMTSEGVEKACEVLRACKALLSQLDTIETVVFATASLRNISNTKEVVDLIFLRTGYRVHVISGHEEAFLDYFGVLHGISLEKGVLVDIGGGSTEIATFAADGPAYMESIPIGSLRLYTEMVSKFLPRDTEIERIQERAQRELKKVKFEKLPHYDVVCSVGGTARALLQLIQEQDKLPADNHSFTCEQFRRLKKSLLKRDETAKKLILRVCPERVHTIVPGMLILDVILKQLNSKMIYVSPYGVREGYLLRHCLKPIEQ